MNLSEIEAASHAPNRQPPFRCAVPANEYELRQLQDLEQKLFGTHALPLGVMNEIFATRPETFNAVFTRDGTVAAYSTAFPLRPAWRTALISGHLAEAGLRPEMIYKRGDCHTDTFIYVSAVAVDPTCDPILKSVLLGSLLWFRVHQLWSASVRCLSMIMTIVSNEGERLARRLGARKINDRMNRRDGLDVFGCDLTPDLLRGVFGTAEVFPFSQTIQMNFSVFR
jgi:hypothetical protein